MDGHEQLEPQKDVKILGKCMGPSVYVLELYYQAIISTAKSWFWLTEKNIITMVNRIIY